MYESSTPRLGGYFNCGRGPSHVGATVALASAGASRAPGSKPNFVITQGAPGIGAAALPLVAQILILAAKGWTAAARF
jgi:hypothetical protein